MSKKTVSAANSLDIRREAEERLKKNPSSKDLPISNAEVRRLNHELEVHQLELEMQNAELRESRSNVEELLQTYTDLYDFAPVGYLSIDETGSILEANLAGAALLASDRARLINRHFRAFIAPPERAKLENFLKGMVTIAQKQVWTVTLIKANGVTFSAEIQGVPAASLRKGRKWIRLAISDLTDIKEARGRAAGLAVENDDQRLENRQQHKVAKALKTSELQYAHVLEHSQLQHAQLKHLSQQLLLSQEEERRRISRELHDEVLQTLVGINVHLSSLVGKALVDPKKLQKTIVRTQKLVAKSVEIVHRFARELRPTVLDDLGLVPALKSFIKDFTKRTGIVASLSACQESEKINSSKRTVLYRVAQAALANVHKHAQSRTVRVKIYTVGNLIRLEIQDHGKSFDVKRVLLANRHRRLGLLGSRERVEMVGGTFSIESESGKGTLIRADIPK